MNFLSGDRAKKKKDNGSLHQVCYIEYWKSFAHDKFNSRLWRKERIEYDDFGRIILHITYSQSARRTIRMKIEYDNFGVAHSSTETIKGYAMWNE